MRFYLGTHKAVWLTRAGVPLFVSDRTLRIRRTFPRAIAPWALDSGGFTELSMYGRWTVTPEEYVSRVRLYQQEIGSLDWASPQDWMCEPDILESTGLTVEEHQRLTVENYLRLVELGPDIPFIPVLQGWALKDYLKHVDAYLEAGVDLFASPTVGVGTVCRRQATAEGIEIVRTLADMGLQIHAFGFKKRGLAKVWDELGSADSLAWSYGARRRAPLPGCTHKSCANCMKFALLWRDQLMPESQMSLWPSR